MLQRARRIWAGGVASCLIALTGCLPSDENGSSLPELVLSSSPVDPPSERYTEAEPNDGYDAANDAPVTDSVELIGEIAAGGNVLDRDVFDLGPAQPGQRVHAQIDASIYGDIKFALFDDRNRLLAMINHSFYSASPPTIDIVLRESTSALYALTTTGSGYETPRSYSAYVSLEPPATWAYRPQVVVLDFQGAEGIRIGNRPPIDIPAFDAANIGEQFAGQTEPIIQRMMDLVGEDYAGLDITFYRAGDPAIPEGEHTTVYFGTYDQSLLGLADSIDPYNTSFSQAAVVYTDTFALFNVLSPSVEEMSQVLANVTSHEVGHLLGLRHTADPHGTMDITATARQMLLDQWFGVSNLHPSVLSTGVQDAPSLLAWTLGGTAPQPPKDRAAILRRAAEAADDPNDFVVPRDRLATCFGEQCDADHVQATAGGQ